MGVMISQLNLKAVYILVVVALCLGAAVGENVVTPSDSSPGDLRLRYHQGNTKIHDCCVDISQIHHDSKSNGDTWDYIWADDGNVYSFGCDGKGYGATNAMNLNFNCLPGADSSIPWLNMA